jgi:hypothetical protein
LGPTCGYSYFSRELKASAVFDGTQINRVSTLTFQNEFTTGYRINVGYDVFVYKNYYLGLRADFSNNNSADINTLAAIKIGKSF